MPALGWNPLRSPYASNEVMQSRQYCTVTPAALDEPMPKAWSLTGYRVNWYDQKQAGTCFLAGTHIRLANGSERKIEELRLLDEVVTAEGNTGAVHQMMVRPYDGVMLNVMLWGHSHLWMTPEHPVLTKRGYVQAKNIWIGDWVAMPRYLPDKATLIHVNEHVIGPRRAKTRDRTTTYAGVRGRPGLKVQVKALPDVIHITSGLGRILGLFLAEGNTEAHKIIWTFNINEEKTLAADLITLLESELGLDAKTSRDEAHHVFRVKVYGSLWARLFESLCGTGAGNKRVHSSLTQGPRDFLVSLFQGWMDGDSSAHGRGRRGVSVSHDLALSMYDIAQAIGLMPSILKAKPIVNRYAKTRQPRWEVDIQSKSENYRVKQDEKYVWRKVRGIEEGDYQGPVYNIGVEGDNSYVAEGIGVHNCWVHSPKMMGEILGKFKNYQSYPICRMLIGWFAKQQYEGGGNQTNGGVPTDAVRAMCKGGCGIAHEDAYPYSDDPRDLARKPPKAVWDDAADTFFESLVMIKSLDQVKPLLLAGSGICTGIPWPENWEEPKTFHSTRGRIVGGHSELMVGWADPGVFDQYGWVEMENWRNLPYPPLPPSLAKQVQGYESVKPDRTNSQWIRQDVFQANCRGQVVEFVSAVDITGMDAGIVIPAPGFGSDSWL